MDTSNIVLLGPIGSLVSPLSCSDAAPRPPHLTEHRVRSRQPPQPYSFGPYLVVNPSVRYNDVHRPCLRIASCGRADETHVWSLQERRWRVGTLFTCQPRHKKREGRRKENTHRDARRIGACLSSSGKDWMACLSLLPSRSLPLAFWANWAIRTPSRHSPRRGCQARSSLHTPLDSGFAPVSVSGHRSVQRWCACVCVCVWESLCGERENGDGWCMTFGATSEVRPVRKPMRLSPLPCLVAGRRE